MNAEGQVERHGATMLYLIYDRVDPTTEVGMDVHLKKLERCKMGDHDNDVAIMLRYMEEHCQTLRHNGKEPSNYRRLLLDALLTGPNATFNGFIQRIVDDVESGTGSNRRIQPHAVVAAARAKFNNMKVNGDWSKVDPRDAQILALTTQVNELKTSRSTALATGKTNSDDVFQTDDGVVLSKGRIPGTKVARYRTEFKGDIIVINGKKNYFCKNHKKKGKWDGLYCWHHPDKCPLIKNKDDSADSGDKPAGGNLKLKAGLKSVLKTKMLMGDQEIEELLSQADAQGN